MEDKNVWFCVCHFLLCGYFLAYSLIFPFGSHMLFSSCFLKYDHRKSNAIRSAGEIKSSLLLCEEICSQNCIYLSCVLMYICVCIHDKYDREHVEVRG